MAASREVRRTVAGYRSLALVDGLDDAVRVHPAHVERSAVRSNVKLDVLAIYRLIVFDAREWVVEVMEEAPPFFILW